MHKGISNAGRIANSDGMLDRYVYLHVDLRSRRPAQMTIQVKLDDEGVVVDAWQEDDEKRKVFKFKLSLRDKQYFSKSDHQDLDHNRLIPSTVKLEVFKRDQGKCIKCGSEDNLHYDHILPFAKGGTSVTAENIQILCARHNLEKSDKIE